ncbi:MAG: hypothetical protein XD73_0113 [Anaerolinea thermophila]|uniref:Metallo-beta-lactamase domain-containing protein n=1 Tax=Anaerolinea thermophila TaxID=167964 RepID=A0A101FZ34_9CHLR|nr:MAG: hypothetical protein XD73_0113 [Anaerolinea thermophila]
MDRQPAMQTYNTIQTFTIGQIENNTYLLMKPDSRKAVVIDPAAGISEVIDSMHTQNLELESIWVTHAHFDHIAGVYSLLSEFGSHIPIFLHPDDLPLWNSGGGAREFGFEFDPKAQPTRFFFHGQHIPFGDSAIEVRHTPGHTPGHVLLYWQASRTAFCGDLIFYHSIGRTDMAYCDSAALRNSIREQVLTLPDATALFCGHGPVTSVSEERKNNPFLD